MKIELKHVIAALIVGVLLGAVGSAKLAPHRFGGKGGDPQKFHQRLMQTFTRKLGLNAEQQQKVSGIMQETRAQMETLRAQMGPKFKEIRSGTQARIREVLTPEQQQKFDALTTKQEARFKQKRGIYHRKG